MSKAYEALNDLIQMLEDEHYELSEDKRVVERKRTVEAALEALEIVKEKGLDILEFRCAFSLYEYNACKNIGCEELTPEEYGLLKEVLK